MIRLVVLILIAVNLLYFGWSHWVARQHTVLTATTSTAAKPAAEPTPPPPCASLGPVTDELLAMQVQEKLTASGLPTVQRATRETLHEGWWVYVVGTSSEQQSRTLAALRRAGLRDAFAMPDDAEFRVSVGIFSEEARATDRAAQVRRLKLEPAITERLRDQTTIWFDMPGIAQEALRDGRLSTAGIDLDALRIEACPTPNTAPTAPAAADIIPPP